MVNGKHTRHHLSTLRNILQSGVVHTSSLNRCNLLLLSLLDRTLSRCGGLIVALFRRHMAVTCKVPIVTTIVTGVIVGACSLLPLLLCRGTWCPLLLWQPSDPTTLLQRAVRSLLSPCLNQLVLLRCIAGGSHKCLPFLVSLVC